MNRLRVVTLSLLVLVTVAGALPVTESLAKWSRRSAASQRKRARYRRHSRAWWRRHRALQRARRARLEQRRLARAAATQAAAQAPVQAVTSLLTFGAPAANANANANAANAPAAAATPGRTPALSSTPARASMPRTSPLPFDFATPHNWSLARKGRAGAAVFQIAGPDGRAAGTAVVAPVSLSAAELSGAAVNAKTKTVGGFPVNALRRTVIDRMVAEGGWVTNDFVQELRGRRVFVVLAQTGAPGSPAQTWAFYFTEVDGRVYSLATTGPVDFAAPLAAGSEQFMASLRPAASTNSASQR